MGIGVIQSEDLDKNVNSCHIAARHIALVVVQKAIPFAPAKSYDVAYGQWPFSLFGLFPKNNVFVQLVHIQGREIEQWPYKPAGFNGRKEKKTNVFSSRKRL